MRLARESNAHRSADTSSIQLNSKCVVRFRPWFPHWIGTGELLPDSYHQIHRPAPMKALLHFASFLLVVPLCPLAANAQAPGSVDLSFDPGSGANSTVFAVLPQSDGKVVIGGAYSQVNGIGRNGIARLNSNGNVDTSFDPGSGTNSWVFSIATQTDGKVVIGGWFTQVDGVTRNFIARLNPNGSVDTSFDPGSGANERVYAVALQSDGKIVIGGRFTQVDGVPRRNIARLNTNGSLDTSFDPGTGANNEIRTLAIQNDGKIVVAGAFNQVNGVTRANVARLDANGSVDLSFDPGSGTNSYVSSLALQSDGKVVIGGNFIQIDGVTRSHIGRVNTNGSVDLSFDPGTGANAIVYGVAVQANGKVSLGGEFIQVNGVTRDRIAQLNTDGSVELGFDPGSGANAFVSTVAVSPGKVILGGGFNQINGVTRSCIARLVGTPEVQILSFARNGTAIVLQGVGVPSAVHKIQATDDLSQPFDPNPIGTASADGNGNFQFTDNPNRARRFYRVVNP